MTPDQAGAEDDDGLGDYGHGQPLRITTDWLLSETRSGNRNCAAVLLDMTFQAVRDSSMEPEVKDYVTNFLNHLLDLYDNSQGPFSRRDAAVALSGLRFPRRTLKESDLAVRALAAIRNDTSLGAAGEYLGNFFDQAIHAHRLGGAGQRALEPSLDALYPFDGRGRPELTQDEIDMLAARVLVAYCYARGADGQRLSVTEICEHLADHVFEEPSRAATLKEEQAGKAWEDPLLDKAQVAYPLDAYIRAWTANGEQFRSAFVVAGQDGDALLPEAEVLALLPEAMIRGFKFRNRQHFPGVVASFGKLSK